MCGIAGVIGARRASEEIYWQLYALQHRGQELAGIYAYDGSRGKVVCGAGLIKDVFDTQTIRQLPGSLAIGQVCCADLASDQELAQAVTQTVYRDGYLAIVHEGRLSNGSAIRQRLVNEGAIIQTNHDSELVAHLIARSKEPEVRAQLMEALSQLEGAFCLVVAVNDRLFAAHDPQSFHPLAIGRKREAYFVASESCALDQVRADFLYEVLPGQLIEVNSRGEFWSKSFAVPNPTPCIYNLVYRMKPDSDSNGASVNEIRGSLGRELARECPVEADMVLAVPDSANAMSIGYSEVSKIPTRPGILRNHYVGQKMPRQDDPDRTAQVRIKYNVDRHVVARRRVVVIDDSIRHGDTQRSLIIMLRAAGATEVHVRIASPRMVQTCSYGMEMPPAHELVAFNRGFNEIKEQLNADSLGFLSHEGMLKAIGRRTPFCTACFAADELVQLSANGGAALMAGTG